ncbi:hypothetical protein EV356DRAFT_528925 [Viridothelium virens]|uniref:C3H1-type domain-containing protein n=1 Tax=Viridothelium virens TaxID=1048519 RepID=A0A6A6HLQ4_VIRVR|nr:hypothetical protein EV356DRAFT_528925 [Viridothelium virens]
MALNMEAVSKRVDDGTITALRGRYHQIKTIEEQKDLLIEELFARYEYLSQIHKQDGEQREEERKYLLQSAEDREKGLKAHISELQSRLKLAPFVLVLIDLDGLLFSNDFLREGDSGGLRAANDLHDRVLEYAQSVFTDLPSECTVLARFYGRMDNLGSWLLRNRISPSILRFVEFCQGLMRGNKLFDMIDTGSVWFGADDKIPELLNLHLHNTHCRGIFFGGPRTAAYVQMLERIGEQNMQHRVTLVEAPSERTWAGVPFATTQLGDLFRTSTISNLSTPYVSRVASKSKTPPAQFISKESSESEQSFCSVASRQTTPPGSQLSEMQVTGPATPIAEDQQTSALQPKSEQTTPFTEDPQTSSLRTESQTSAGPAQKPVSLPQTPEPEIRLDLDYIPRNRKGQRIDSELPKWEKHESIRVRNLGLCYTHYLRNDCPLGEKCTKRHDYNPTEAEMQTLKLRARIDHPCVRGPACADPKCIYGHHCPLPSTMKGLRLCVFQEYCKFPPNLHHFDTQPFAGSKAT